MEGGDSRSEPLDPASAEESPNAEESSQIPNATPSNSGSSVFLETDVSPNSEVNGVADNEDRGYSAASTEENPPSVIELHSSRSPGGQSEEGQSSHPVVPPSNLQTTLDAFRPPLVMPNLALQALKHLREKESNEDDEEDEFRPAKKRRVEENEIEDEGQQCSICFEPWSNSGGHRISSLRCGHLFGFNCIEKWLVTNPKCPQCNARSKRGDIRVIYAKSVSAVDTTDRDRALQELESEKNSRISAQKAEAQAVLQYQLARAECDRLKEEIKTLKKNLEYFSTAVKCEGGVGSEAGGNVECVGVSSDKQGQYELYKTINISQSGNSRVLGYDSHQRMLVATKPSSNVLYPGYGLIKVSTVDLQHSEYVPIHSPSGVIRDVVFSPRGDGMVLTAATDKTAKLTSLLSNTVAQSFQTSHPVWACAWDHDHTHLLYCGLQNGVVQVYDTRRTTSHVTELRRPTGGCPITSLSHVPLCRAGGLSCGGLLMGTLGGCVFWEKSSQDKFTHHPLTSLPEAACTCLTFDPITRHCLASFRPCRGTPHTRHTLLQLKKDCVENRVSCQAVNEFKGGHTHKLLSRSKLFERPSHDGRLLAAFGEEATKSVHILDISSSRKLQHMSLGKSPALDMIPFDTDSKHSFLSVLTESKMFVYKWTWL